MPATRAETKSIYLVAGNDEFSVKETAAQLAGKLTPKSAGEFGVEIIDVTVSNQDDARKALSRLNEALQTVGFFGGEKLVWLKSTELLADTITTRTEAVKEALAELAESLKRGLPEGVSLLISAIGCDRRKSLYKTIEKLGEVKFFDTLDESKEAGEEAIAEFLEKRLHEAGKTMTSEARSAFRELVAPEFRTLAMELEKLCLYVGKRNEIVPADVRAIVSVSRQAVIWELTDALGSRHLPRAMAALDQLLGQGESAIGVLMMLVAQFRLTLLARDLIDRKVLIPRENAGWEYAKGFEKLPAEQTAHFPRNKDGGLPNAWRLYRCALGARNFTTAELIRAMDLLLDANQQLVTTQLEENVVLAEVLAKIALKPKAV